MINQQPTALALVQREQEWTTEQKRIIKNVVCPGISDDELYIFAKTCVRTGLDPFTSPPQIYAMIRNQKNSSGGYERRLTIETSINGFRSLGESTGQYEGIDGPYWCGDDGKWVDVWLGAKPPSAAKVGILRQGFAKPVYGVATYRSFYQDKSPLWNKMPDRMLAIAAERAAWSQAFPRRCGGLYVPEEFPSPESQPTPLHTIEAVEAPAEADLPQLPEGKTWPEWCKELQAQVGLCDNKDEYFALIQAVTLKDPRAGRLVVADWQRFASYLQQQIEIARKQDEELVAGLAEEDAGLAKMAGIGEGEPA